MTEEGIYYVYMHFDPKTNEILYVGMGKGSRAYATKTTKVEQAAYGHRSPEHSNHLDQLMNEGYLPHEWIEFISRGLERTTALIYEKEYIGICKPKYNRKHGLKHLKFNKEDVLKFKELRKTGLYYSQIADLMGCSPMVAHRIINDLSPRYKELFYDN